MPKNDLFPETTSRFDQTVESAVPTIDEASTEPMAGNGAGTFPGREDRSYLGTSMPADRLRVFFFGLFGLLAVLAVRAGFLDLARGNAYRLQAEGNRLRLAPIPSERGIIYDRAGRLLTRNIPDFTLTVTPADLPRDAKARSDLIVRLAEIVGLTPVDIEKTLRRYPERLTSAIPLKEHLEYDQAVRLDILSGNMPGVALIAGTKREYLLNGPGTEEPVLSLSHLLGYQGRINEAEYDALKSEGYLPADFIGKTGLEASYERQLRGRYGKKQIEVDAFGREQAILAQDDPTQGRDLTLTVDTALQAAAERSLRASAARNGRRRGAAVAIDPENGEILALVSWPAYDANVFSRGITLDEYRALAENGDQPLYPRAVSGLYPPGSTIKTAVAAAALAERLITPQTTIVSTGGIRVSQWFFPDWKRGGHGVTDVIKAIAESVNTFFYAVGGGWERFEGLGVKRLESYLAKFGLGDKLGVDLPGEGRGFLPTEEWKARAKKLPWYIGDTYHLSIGQGDILATPLQAAAWTAVFANGGDLVRPHLVKEIRSEREIESVSRQVIRQQVVPKDAIDVVRKGMRQTVLSGSAQSLQLSPWPIAGKTGTAEWRDGQPPHAWFVGFAPYDKPKIAVAVLIEAGGEGSHSAAPVARDIIEAYLRKHPVDAEP